jgi:hypothetical protein
MNPDFHFVLAMDATVCTAGGVGNVNVTSCIVMLKDVIKVLLLQKGQKDWIKNIISMGTRV